MRATYYKALWSNCFNHSAFFYIGAAFKHTNVKHLLFFALLWCSFTAFASGEWATYYNSQSVQILYRFEDCHDDVNGIHQQKVFFKFVNLSGKNVTVNFAKQLTYSGRTSTGDKAYTLTLKPGQTLQGDCTTHDKTFFSFAKHLNMEGSKLEKFDLKNITVTTLD